MAQQKPFTVERTWTREDLGLWILVLQRGWVVVGRMEQAGGQITLHDGAVIRRWGTTRGLGQIAADGPTAATVLDPVQGRIRAHEYAVVAQFECEASKWTRP